MKQPNNVFLIGPPGAGKSAVGRQLARLLHMTFFDSDDEIEARTGVDIPFIFEKEGEEGFRKREAKVIDDLTAKDGIVLATGGGAIPQHTSPASRLAMTHGAVPVLAAPVGKARNRGCRTPGTFNSVRAELDI